MTSPALDQFADLVRSQAETLATDRILGSLEDLLTDPRGFGLTKATPVQRAICRVADGRPLAELLLNPDVIAALGGVDAARLAHELGGMPKEIVLLAGIRGGKSTIVAAAAIRAAWSCDLSQLAPGEIPLAPILSVKLDTAKATWNHVVGQLEQKPMLRQLIIGETKASSVMVRNKGGRPVEIKIVAGGRAAASLVSRWLVTFIADEAPRLVGAEDGVANLDDARHAVAGRLLPGAQSFLIGSPWAPMGPVYELDQEHFRKPSRTIVIFRATGPQMNPSWWTPERCEALRVENPDAHRVDVEVGYLAPESSMFSEDAIKAIEREDAEDIPPQPGHKYAATMDPATRGNSWTLTIGTCVGMVGSMPRYSVVAARQRTGSRVKPLDPKEVIAEYAELCRAYGIDAVMSDQWSNDALRSIAAEFKFYIMEDTATNASNVEQFDRLKLAISLGALSLPKDPYIRADLIAVKRRITQNGVAIVLPRTADGRHADYAPAIARLCSQYIEPALELPKHATKREAEAAAWQAKVENRIARESQQSDDADGFGPAW